MVESEQQEFVVPEEFRFTYLFHGAVHPARAKVSLYDLGTAKVTLKTAGVSRSGFMRLKGENSEFLATLYSDSEIDDLLTLRNLVRDHVDARVNVLGFFQGTYYEAEVVACTPPNGEKFDFSVELPAISTLCKSNPKRADPRKLISHPSFRRFAGALKDFKIAMKEPGEAYYLVYRAIEGIRVYFAEQAGLDAKADKRKSWEHLKSRMLYQQDAFKFLEDDATARRHGEQPLHTEAEIVNCLEFGWQFLYRFLEVVLGTDFQTPP